MTDLFLLSRSLDHAALAALNAFFGALGPAAAPIVVASSALPLTLPPGAKALAYPDRLGIERSPELFADLRRGRFGRIVVLGTAPRADFEEIVLACYLDAGQKLYLDGGSGQHDIVEKWQPILKPDFSRREVRVRRLSEELERDYVANVHKWLGAQLHMAGYGRPRPLYERSPGTLLYVDPHLATDLVQQTFDLQIENHGASFSTLATDDGIVHSTDFYRAMANFIDAVPGIGSILDVGCGSGFLSCHLAGLGAGRTIVGVDAAPVRVAGASLHAELAGIRAIEFRQTSMDRLDFPDGSFDAVVTSFALEQSGAALGRVIAELRRVARKYLVLFEPSTEYFPTLPSLWHVPHSGWASRYFAALTDAGISYAVRPNLLRHYYNPGSVFVVDLTSDRNPVLTLPHLFRSGIQDWPGGVRIE